MHFWSGQYKQTIPGFAYFVASFVRKYPQLSGSYIPQVLTLVKLLLTEVRVEGAAVTLALAVLEKMASNDTNLPKYMYDVVFNILTSVHFYKNSTVKKMVPFPVIRMYH